VAFVSGKIQSWIDRLGAVWVEGEVIQYNPRPGAGMQYFTLRDLNQQASIDVTVFTNTLQRSGLELERGAKVLVYAKPNYYAGSGRLSLRASEIRAVGIGDLLARLEHLKRILESEGLFAHERKKALPFLPSAIGLITGRNSDAMHDVINNSRLRWPSVRFEVREVAVQGADSVPQVMAALVELDALGHVEVIVIARGGGGIEDLLPFSDEGLVRAVFAASTPVVSAIGHERDNPILDFVADLRASTPTDAAKRIVPDVGELRLEITDAQRAMRRAITNLLERHQHSLDEIRSRPVLATPATMVEARAQDLAFARGNLRHRFESRLQSAEAGLASLTASLRSLSPRATMERGFAIVQRADGAVVRSVADVSDGDTLLTKLADGSILAKALKVKPDDPRR
jgi:exodeoxyribonuclease VII large subunit